jgi:hypothetical protein
MVNITTQLSQKDYIQASLIILYRKPLVFIVSFLLLILLGVNMTMMMLGYRITADAIALPIVLLFVTPFSTFISSRRSYKANKTAGERLNYEFKGNTLTVSANGASSQAKISDFQKAFKSSKWIFLVNSAKNVNPIPRRDITEQQLAEIKSILTKNGVRSNL